MSEELNPFERERKSPSDAGPRVAKGIYRRLGSCYVSRSKTFHLPGFVWAHIFQVKSPPDVLYRRDVMHDIEKQLIQAGDHVLLYGPPGCGKSICAFLHAVNLSNGPNHRRILWIDIQSESHFLIDRGSVSSCDPDLKFSLLSGRDDITDVYVDQLDMFYGWWELRRDIVPWSFKRGHHRKVTIILSDMYHCTIGCITWRTVQVPPWSFQDYREALSIDGFRNAFINHHELSPDLTDDQMTPYIMRHFYFAGGSARLFFHQCTDLAIKSVEKLTYTLPRTWFRRHDKFEPRQFISSYAVIRLGVRLPPAGFVPYISLMDGKFAHCYFEAFVLSCIAHNTQTPSPWVPSLFKLSFTAFDKERIIVGDHLWLLPRHDRLRDGLTCFNVVDVIGAIRFMFLFATTSHQHQVDTKAMLDLVAVILAAERKPQSILVEIVFAIPQRNVDRFRGVVTGDWSELSRVSPIYSNTSHTIRIWPVSGCDSFLDPSE